MMKIFLYFIIALCFLTGCCLLKKAKTEIWQDSPDATTTKIRVTTRFSTDSLRVVYIDRLLRSGFEPDLKSGLVPMRTKIRKVDNYYVELYITFEDSVATVYGNAGFVGRGGIGREPSAENVAWEPIKFNSKGWEAMSVIAESIDLKKQEYNAFR